MPPLELFNIDSLLLSEGYLSIFSIEPDSLSLPEDKEKYEEFLELFANQGFKSREFRKTDRAGHRRARRAGRQFSQVHVG